MQHKPVKPPFSDGRVLQVKQKNIAIYGFGRNITIKTAKIGGG
jgi:hypothetical protein